MRRGVLILLVVGGVAAILIGIYAVTRPESQADAQANFCSSLDSLDSDVQALQALDPATASKSDYQDAVDSIQGAWDNVKTDASDLASVDMSTLDSAWDSFKSSVERRSERRVGLRCAGRREVLRGVTRLDGEVDSWWAGLLELLTRETARMIMAARQLRGQPDPPLHA